MVGYGQGTSRARLPKGALLWPNGQIDIPAVLPMPKVAYKGYLGCWVQWVCLFGDLPSMWLGMAKARIWHVSWMAPYYDPMVKLTFQQFCRCKKLYRKVILGAEFNGMCLFGDLSSVWLGMAMARIGHVSWRAPYYDPMVKLPFRKFCRCKKLFIKVIWDDEFNGCVCSVICRLCGWVWLRHVLGTSPEGRPIMTQWSNWHSSSSADAKTCIQRLFGMLSSMDVSVWWSAVYVVGYGQGTSRARLLKGALLWPNGQIAIPEVLPLQKVVYKGYLGCWVQWMCLFGDLPSMWLGLAKARLGHVSWRAPYYDPMVKLTFQQFCRCKNLHTKVIWEMLTIRKNVSNC